MMIFAFVSQRRQELGLTQVELANKSNVSLKVIRRFESPRTYNPHGSNCIKVAKALGVTLDYLLFECTWQ